jgi:hypothetical protein
MSVPCLRMVGRANPEDGKVGWPERDAVQALFVIQELAQPAVFCYH